MVSTRSMPAVHLSKNRDDKVQNKPKSKNSKNRNDKVQNKPKSKNAIASELKKKGKIKVDFGMYKNKDWTYDQLIKKRETYARIITRQNYDVPKDFKEYMCYKFI